MADETTNKTTDDKTDGNTAGSISHEAGENTADGVVQITRYIGRGLWAEYRNRNRQNEERERRQRRSQHLLEITSELDRLANEATNWTKEESARDRESLIDELMEPGILEAAAQSENPKARAILKDAMRERNISTEAFNEFEITVERAIGLHSNIPQCCVEDYIGERVLVSAADRTLSALEVGQERAKRYRSLYAERLDALAGEARPQYQPCERCLEQIELGTIKPNKIHYCEDAQAHPLCAYMIDLRSHDETPMAFPKDATWTPGEPNDRRKTPRPGTNKGGGQEGPGKPGKNT